MSKVKMGKEWEDIWSIHSKIDGVWKNSNTGGKVEGDWETSHIHFLEESDILGFRLLYRLNKGLKHPDLPKLSYNSGIPIQFSTTSDSEILSISDKGIVYTYTNDWWSGNYEEGIVSYEGILCAMLDKDIYAAVSLYDDLGEEDSRININHPEIRELWKTNRISHLNINTKCYTYSEGERRLVGWNSLFNQVENLHINQAATEGVVNILPVSKRSNTYHNVSQIGIARSLTTTENNMLGSWGHMSHTIRNITVNGVKKPFTIEIV